MTSRSAAKSSEEADAIEIGFHSLPAGRERHHQIGRRDQFGCSWVGGGKGGGKEGGGLQEREGGTERERRKIIVIVPESIAKEVAKTSVKRLILN